jgi:hypothetical protein
MPVTVGEQYAFEVPKSPKVVAQEHDGHLILITYKSPWVLNCSSKG